MSSPEKQSLLTGNRGSGSSGGTARLGRFRVAILVILDYLVSVIPSDSAAGLRGGTAEEAKILAVSEFLLRHQMEHLLYPKKTEREAIQADVIFVMDRRGDQVLDAQLGGRRVPHGALCRVAKRQGNFTSALNVEKGDG
jgi:hypothetical protein